MIKIDKILRLLRLLRVLSWLRRELFIAFPKPKLRWQDSTVKIWSGEINDQKMRKLERRLKDRTLAISRGTSVKESPTSANKKASGKVMKDMWQRCHVSSREDNQPTRG